MYFDIYKNPKAVGHKYWWAARGANHEILCHSEMLATKQACKNAIKVVKRGASSASVYDETGEIAAVSASARLISV